MSRTRAVTAVAGALVVALGCAAPGAHGPETRARFDVSGDPLPDGACARLGTVRFHLARPVRGLAFSPDGRALAVAGEHEAIVWSVPAGEMLARLAPRGSDSCGVAFSPDGRTLAVLGDAGGVTLFDLASGRERIAREGDATALAWSPGGRTIAIGSLVGRVRLLDARTLADVRAFHAFAGDEVLGLSFAPDGSKLAASSAARISMVELATGRELFPRRAGEYGAALAFGPDGRELAYLDFDAAFVRAVPAGRVLEDLAGIEPRAAFVWALAPPVAAIEALAFAPDGRGLALGGRELALVAGASPGERPRVARRLGGFAGGVQALAYSADARILAVASGPEVALFDARTLEPLVARHRRRITDLAFAPSGSPIATSSLDGTVRLWDASGRALACIDAREPLASVAFSPDGTRLYAGDERGQIHVVDVESGKALENFEDRSGAESIAVSPDGKTLAAVGRGVLGLFATASGQLARPEWLIDADRVAFLPDGRTLAVGVLRDLKLLSLETGDGVWPLALHERGAFALAPDGKTLAITSDETRIVVRDLVSGEVQATLEGEHATRIRSVAFAPDGHRLASASEDGRVVLWDVRAGEKPRVLVDANPDPERIKIRVAFSPDGRELAVYGEENTALIFTVPD